MSGSMFLNGGMPVQPNVQQSSAASAAGPVPGSIAAAMASLRESAEPPKLTPQTSTEEQAAQVQTGEQPPDDQASRSNKKRS
eukprot:5655571-Amphidinium_carterae.1